MTDRTHSFVYGRGEAQSSRYDIALAPASARVDDRGLPELLAYLAEFARLVGFVDGQGEPTGDWTRFFEEDESFLLAQVCATTVDSLAGSPAVQPAAADDAGATVDSEDNAAPRASESASLLRIFTIARRFDAWYQIAARLKTTAGIEAHPFARNLERVIGNDLSRYTLQIEADKTLGAEWRRLGERANVRFAAVWSNDAGRSISFDPDDLAPVASAFERALANLTVLARRYLESSQRESGDHAPHTGLLIAFVKLLGVVRDELNEFTGRHLQYYLGDVLRLAPRPSQPDQSLVAFTLAPRAAPVLLDAGRRLSAGMDTAGLPIEFATSAPLVVTPAQITSLMALSATYVDGGSGGDSRPLTSIVAYPVANSADGFGAKLAQPALGWPTFGPDRDDAIAAGNPAPDGQVGFVIASPLLLLMGGERTITLSFELGDAGEGVRLASVNTATDTATASDNAAAATRTAAGNTGSAYARLERLATAYARSIARSDGATLAAAPSPTPRELLGRLLADACLVTLSGKNGWFAPQHARLSVSTAGTLDLVIGLSAAAPAVLANPAFAFDQSEGSPLPMLRVLMNPDAPVYGYSFFEALRARSAHLDVQVRGLQSLELQNNLGPLVPGKPFMPFGPAPTLGSFLQIGSPELACKPVSHIGLQIDWFNLPGAGGFSAYYRGYPLDANGEPLTRESFVAGIDRNDGIAWQPASADRTSRFALFAAAAGQPANVAASTRFELDLGTQPAPATFGEALAPTSQAGALRIALAAPAGAFGYDVYSRALAEAVLQNSRAGRRAAPGELTPIPNPPFVPMASALSLDYVAQARIDFDALDGQDALRFYTLAPFGHVRAHRGLETRFVPEGVCGALFIGLTQASPGDKLSLLFHLADRHAPQSFDFTQAASRATSGTALTWHYLAGNCWRPFRKENVLADSTYGLTCSGIAEFVLPVQIDEHNTMMPAGCFWLAAMVSSGVEAVCDTIAILPNAVAVSRVTSGEMVIANLPPQSITGLVTKLPAIKSVVQPLQSWSGLPAETADAFAARVAERLRHKQRAIQPYDYERLVLASFADITQAKCIGPGNSRGYSAVQPLPAGQVMVVVAARTSNAPAYIDQGTLRAALDMLRPYVSPFLHRLTVRNPAYERLKVVAAVRLKPDRGAFYLSRLSGELDEALAPWRKEPAGRLPIGYGAIDGNSIASFIRQRDYVELLEEFHMEVLYNVSPDGTGNDWRGAWFAQNDVVRPSTPWSVLVPSGDHVLQQVDGRAHDGAAQAEPAPAGIGSLTIGDDFVASPSTAAPAAAAPDEPVLQPVYYVKFLDSALRRDHRRHGARDSTAGRDAELLQDAFIEFPDHDAQGPANGAADPTET